MADNEILNQEEEYANRGSIIRLWERIAQTFVRKDGTNVLSDNNFSDEEKEKLEALKELEPATSDTLGGIKVGAGLAVTKDGTLSVESAGEVVWADIKNTPDTLEGYGITDAATKEELDAVVEKASKIYNYKGSLETYEELEAIENPSEGDVWNIKADGKNYRWTLDGQEAFWDDLGGTFKIDVLTPEDIDIITGYATSAEAFEMILENGGTLELGADVTLAHQEVITQDVTIDLNEHVLNTSLPKAAEQELFVADGAVLTIKGAGNLNANYRLAKAINGGQIVIKGGSFDSGGVGFTAYGTGSRVTFDNGNLTAVEGGIGAFDGAEIEVNGGTIEISDNFALFTNGTKDRGGNIIMVNDGLMIGNIKTAGYEACGVYIANNDTFIMNGGEVRANGGTGLCMRAGEVTINDGVIIATNVNKDGQIVTDGMIGDDPTVMAGCSAVIYHETANYPGKAGMKLTINGGEFTGVDHAVEVLSNEAEPAVFINGGEFVPALS